METVFHFGKYTAGKEKQQNVPLFYPSPSFLFFADELKKGANKAFRSSYLQNLPLTGRNFRQN